jgi:hypothetical protein
LAFTLTPNYPLFVSLEACLTVYPWETKERPTTVATWRAVSLRYHVTVENIAADYIWPFEFGKKKKNRCLLSTTILSAQAQDAVLSQRRKKMGYVMFWDVQIRPPVTDSLPCMSDHFLTIFETVLLYFGRTLGHKIAFFFLPRSPFFTLARCPAYSS